MAATPEAIRVDWRHLQCGIGPRMHRADDRVVSNFIIHALIGAPITLYGNGNRTRSFRTLMT